MVAPRKTETNGDRSSKVPMLLPAGNDVDVPGGIDELSPICYHTSSVPATLYYTHVYGITASGIDVLNPISYQSNRYSPVLTISNQSHHQLWCSYSDPGPYNSSSMENRADHMQEGPMRFPRFLWL